jgi:hypothetical protein
LNAAVAQDVRVDLGVGITTTFAVELMMRLI